MVFKFTKRTGKNLNRFQVKPISFACLIDIRHTLTLSLTNLTEITEKKLKVQVNVPSKSFYYTTL